MLSVFIEENKVLLIKLKVGYTISDFFLYNYKSIVYRTKPSLKIFRIRLRNLSGFNTSDELNT